jgi:hypothetical protein
MKSIIKNPFKNTLIEKVGYFDLKWHTCLTVDASPVGLAAVLTQQNPEGLNDQKVIIYISRKLTETEQRYSQIEKESLAIVWSCERLQLYLLGRKFTLFTDNKAVALIFSNPLHKPPARIQRWELRLSSFDFTIQHRPGIGNISDFLSRHPLSKLKEEPADFIN